MAVGIGDTVRVRNLGARPIKCKWDSRDYPISVGGETFMPFECMKLYFGDPRAAQNLHSVRDDRGVVGFVSDRATEVRRLRLLWDHSFGEYIPGEVNAFETDRIPHVAVYDLHNNPIPTVLDDPEGNQVIAAAPQTVAQQADLLTVVQNQGKLIELLMERLGMDKASIAGANLPPIEPEPKMMYDPKKDEVVKKPSRPVADTDDDDDDSIIEELGDLPEAEE